jgi:hypothetical protein
LPTDASLILLRNEDGLLLNLPPNPLASVLALRSIMGAAVLMSRTLLYKTLGCTRMSTKTMSDCKQLVSAKVKKLIEAVLGIKKLLALKNYALLHYDL